MTTNSHHQSDSVTNVDIDRRSIRKGLHLMIFIPSLLALVALGVGIINYQIADVMADSAAELVAAEALRKMSIYSLISAIVMTIIGTIFGLGLAYSVAKPLKEIIKAAGDGIAGTQVPIKSSESIIEINQVGDTFNKLMKDLYLLFRQRDSFLLQSNPVGFIILDPKGVVLSSNPQAEKLLKLESKDILGKNFYKLSMKETYPDLTTMISNVLSGKSDYIEQSLTSTKQDQEQEQDQESEVIKISCALLKDRQGQPSGCVISLSPFANIENLKRKLKEVDRLATLGTFTAGLVHEIRNPIASIKGLSQLLSQSDLSSEKAKTFLGEIKNESSRLNRLLQDLNQFADTCPEQLRQPCNLNFILGNALNVTKSSFPEAQSFIYIDEVYEPIPEMTGFPDRIMQAFLNILKNAFEATPPGGHITLKTGYAKSHSNKTGDILLEISNTGSYIPLEEQQKIFEPFYSAKIGGSGLGLPISAQIIAQHGGEITVDSNKKKTSFYIRFYTMNQNRG